MLMSFIYIQSHGIMTLYGVFMCISLYLLVAKVCMD